MGTGRVNAGRLSGRQLSVAMLVAGLSPAAGLAGSVSWPWVVFWYGVGIVLAWIALKCMGTEPLFSGKRGIVLSILYKVGAVVAAARVLSRAAGRLEVTSGGSPGFWLLVVIAIPLLVICWGKPAPFFRMTEILWLAMAVVLAVVLTIGLLRVEWQYVALPSENWIGSLWAVCEILSPALFLLPLLNRAEECSNERGILWVAALGGIAALLCLITGGVLGRAAEQIPHGFYVAAGLLGKSARCEGLLSVLWLLPDLTLAGLVCRVWGERRWPIVGAILAVILSVSGLVEKISGDVIGICVLFLWILTLFLKGKIRNSG